MSTPATETTGNKPNLADAARVSELKGLGWSVRQADDKTWSAFENAGDLRTVGPASNIKALHTQVTLASGSKEAKDSKTVKVGSTKLEGGEFRETGPEQRLPTMEEPEIDALNVQADKCIEKFEAKKKAAAASKDEDDIMRQKMHEYDRKRYARHGWSIVIEDSEKLVIKKAESAPPMNPKVKKGQLPGM